MRSSLSPEFLQRRQHGELNAECKRNQGGFGPGEGEGGVAGGGACHRRQGDHH